MILYHFTSKDAAHRIAQDQYLRVNPPMPPRYMDRREVGPDVLFLTLAESRAAQRWAMVPDAGVRGLSYTDKTAVRIAIECDERLGGPPRSFRQWALDWNVPLAWIAETAQGGSTDPWYVLPREVPRPEWIEIAVWNGLSYLPALTRERPDEALLS